MHALILRPIGPDDVGPLFHWRNDPRIGRWMYSDRRTIESFTSDYLAETPGHQARAICASGTLIGFVHWYTRADNTIAWGHYLNPDEIGKGYGRATEQEAARWIFEVCNHEKVWLEVYLSNRRVWTMHKRFGYRVEDLWPAHRPKDGEPGDVVVMSMTAGEYAALSHKS